MTDELSCLLEEKNAENIKRIKRIITPSLPKQL